MERDVVSCRITRLLLYHESVVDRRGNVASTVIHIVLLYKTRDKPQYASRDNRTYRPTASFSFSRSSYGLAPHTYLANAIHVFIDQINSKILHPG